MLRLVNLRGGQNHRWVYFYLRTSSTFFDTECIFFRMIFPNVTFLSEGRESGRVPDKYTMPS